MRSTRKSTLCTRASAPSAHDAILRDAMHYMLIGRMSGINRLQEYVRQIMKKRDTLFDLAVAHINNYLRFLSLEMDIETPDYVVLEKAPENFEVIRYGIQGGTDTPLPAEANHETT